MRRITILLIAAVVALGLVAFTMTYTVRFTEAAVKTTFGKATEESVTRDPGLKFKWPYPIQSVTKYDTRARVLSSRLEQVQTGDSRPVTVEAFCTWKVSHPLKFFQRFSSSGERESDHYKAAEALLAASLRSGMAEVSRYRMDDLFTRSYEASKMPALEESMKAAMLARSESGVSLADAGIQVEFVGVGQIKLPEANTQQVMDSMSADRAQIVKALESQGASEAEAITSKARADADRIMAFAELLASTKRRQGDAEAEKWVAQTREQPELAIFLRNLDLLKNTIGKRLTIVLPITDFGLGVMNPARLGSLKPGELPGQQAGRTEADLRREIDELNRRLAELASPPEAPGGAVAPPKDGAAPGDGEARPREQETYNEILREIDALKRRIDELRVPREEVKP